MTVATLGNNDGKLLKLINEEYIELSEGREIQLSLENISGKIQSNLTIGASVTKTIALQANSKLANTGLTVGGRGFILDDKEYKYLIDTEPKSKLFIFPVVNGRDLTDKNRKLWIIDTFNFSEKYLINDVPKTYQYLFEKVYPERQINPDPKLRKYWWLPRRSNEKVRSSILGIKRYIATVLTSKHRVFIFLDSNIRSEISIVVIALDDAYYLGIISSHIHITWALAAGARLGVGNDPRYIKSHCFDPFPLPNPKPEQKQKIRELGEKLDSHRKRVQAQHPEITITGMYNLLEKLRKGETFTEADKAYNNKALVSTLKQIHDELDNAVFDAYEWQDLKDDNKTKAEIEEIILERLVALNAERAEEERNGTIRWLRPEYQAPNEVTQQVLTEVMETEETVIIPTEQKTFPKQPKEQLATIRDLLRTNTSDWTVDQIAAQFKNGGKYKNAIAENLERLEWFGILICRETESTKRWQYVEI